MLAMSTRQTGGAGASKRGVSADQRAQAPGAGGAICGLDFDLKVQRAIAACFFLHGFPVGVVAWRYPHTIRVAAAGLNFPN